MRALNDKAEKARQAKCGPQELRIKRLKCGDVHTGILKPEKAGRLYFSLARRALAKDAASDSA
jgi:hypothetical protein